MGFLFFFGSAKSVLFLSFWLKQWHVEFTSADKLSVIFLLSLLFYTDLTYKQVGISKKCTLKKFSSNSKEENKLKILQFLLNLIEKNKIAFNFLHAIEELDFLVVIQGKKNSFG
jgi:hypothetical protein